MDSPEDTKLFPLRMSRVMYESVVQMARSEHISVRELLLRLLREKVERSRSPQTRIMH
jgi:hypothetical protein